MCSGRAAKSVFFIGSRNRHARVPAAAQLSESWSCSVNKPGITRLNSTFNFIYHISWWVSSWKCFVICFENNRWEVEVNMWAYERVLASNSFIMLDCCFKTYKILGFQDSLDKLPIGLFFKSECHFAMLSRCLLCKSSCDSTSYKLVQC